MISEVPTRKDLQRALIVKCMKEPEFKNKIVADPKGVLEGHLGKKLPESLKIYIHEETPAALHFTIPQAPTNISELSDEDLEKVAGGTDFAMTLITVVMSLGTAASVATGIGGGVTVSQGW